MSPNLTAAPAIVEGVIHQAVMKHPPQSTGRTIAIGDVHGCAGAFAALVEAIRPDAHDHIVPLGDVIDYGPDSRGVLEMLLSLVTRSNVTLLVGNHEEMLFKVLDHQWDAESWTRHGGDRTLASFGIEHPRDLPADVVSQLRDAKAFLETESHILVHAGYYPNLPLVETPASALFWEFLEPGRSWPHYSGKRVVVGHTPQTTGRILDLGHVVCIDTDASRGQWLTALDLGSETYWQANERGEVRQGRLTPRRERS